MSLNVDHHHFQIVLCDCELLSELQDRLFRSRIPHIHPIHTGEILDVVDAFERVTQKGRDLDVFLSEHLDLRSALYQQAKVLVSCADPCTLIPFGREGEGESELIAPFGDIVLAVCIMVGSTSGLDPDHFLTIQCELALVCYCWLWFRVLFEPEEVIYLLDGHFGGQVKDDELAEN